MRDIARLTLRDLTRTQIVRPRCIRERERSAFLRDANSKRDPQATQKWFILPKAFFSVERGKLKRLAEGKEKLWILDLSKGSRDASALMCRPPRKLTTVRTNETFHPKD